MAINRKKNVKSVDKLERRDRAFAVLITILVLIAVVAPIVLFIFNPFGWNLTSSSNEPTTTETTPNNSIRIDADKIITSSSDQIIEGSLTSYTKEFSYGGYSFKLGFATDSGGSISIGSVSKPQYMFKVIDNEEYRIAVAMDTNDNKTTITAIDAYNSSGAKIGSRSPETNNESGMMYWYKPLKGTTEIHHITFSYKVK